MAKAKTYDELKSELDSLMLELQGEGVGVDRALECYQRGLALVKQLEAYLQTAENKVRELKAEFERQP